MGTGPERSNDPESQKVDPPNSGLRYAYGVGYRTLRGLPSDSRPLDGALGPGIENRHRSSNVPRQVAYHGPPSLGGISSFLLYCQTNGRQTSSTFVKVGPNLRKPRKLEVFPLAWTICCQGPAASPQIPAAGGCQSRRSESEDGRRFQSRAVSAGGKLGGRLRGSFQWRVGGSLDVSLAWLPELGRPGNRQEALGCQSCHRLWADEHGSQSRPSALCGQLTLMRAFRNACKARDPALSRFRATSDCSSLLL